MVNDGIVIATCAIGIIVLTVTLLMLTVTNEQELTSQPDGE
ncbi:hypothetical protein EMIT0158MI4_90083 [Burkholderia ambifaria]